MVVNVLEGALLVAFTGSALGMLLFGSVLAAQIWDEPWPFSFGRVLVWLLPDRVRNGRRAVALREAREHAEAKNAPGVAKVRAFARRGLGVSVIAFAASGLVIWTGNMLRLFN